MICPGCQSDFWGLFASLDGRHRCASCRNEANRLYVPPVKRVIRVGQVGRPKVRAFTVDECRARNLCIRCCAPAKHYGTLGDYGVHCEACAERSAAKQRAKLVRAREQERRAEGAA